MKLDIFMVGVGGQGILTIGELLSEATRRESTPVNFYPSKGMAQRGGFVKAQLRIGRELVGPIISEKGADLVIAMETSEALKAIRYIKAGGDFILYGDRWEPTAVMLGKAPYPELERVQKQVLDAGARLVYIDPDLRPKYQKDFVAANIFILGAVLKNTQMGKIVSYNTVLEIMQSRWKRGIEANETALKAGMDLDIKIQQGKPAGAAV